MKKLMIILSLIFLFVGCEYETDDNTKDINSLFYDKYDFYSISFQSVGNGINVLIMGDSTMYSSAYCDNLPYNIYNVSKPGITTRGIINRLHFIQSLNIDYVVIGIGINDSKHLSTGEFNSHILTIIDYCNDSGVDVVFIQITDIYGCASENVLYNNIYMSLTCDNYLKWDCLQSETVDGIHFNYSGYTRLSQEIENMIDGL